MFTFQEKEKENEMVEEPTSHVKQTVLNYSRQKAKAERGRKISHLRQVCASQAMHWQLPFQAFLSALEQNGNQYSLLVTMFQIAGDPMWRSWTSHLCSLIQALHNRCLDQDGHYLTEISSIDNYHERLCRIFYLNDNALQEHFKLFMMAYLSYNSQIAILDEPEIALGLIQAGKTRTDGQLPEYLWLVSQVRIDPRGVSKLVKVADDILEEANADNLELVNQTLIPVVSALSNYLCYEQDGFVIDQLIDNDYFQRVFMHSLTQNGNIDLAQEALLLCSNLLGRSADLASKMMCSQQVMSAALAIVCEQQQCFQRVLAFRKSERPCQSYN